MAYVHVHNIRTQLTVGSPTVTTDEEEEEAEKADTIINIKELDDVLMKDVGNKIAASGKYESLRSCGVRS